MNANRTRAKKKTTYETMKNVSIYQLCGDDGAVFLGVSFCSKKELDKFSQKR